jgi:circadian clock protein KaiC
VETDGERNRLLFILKSRGMKHSNQVREFVLSGKGITLLEPTVGGERARIGPARVARMPRERAAAEERKTNHERTLRSSRSQA